MPVPQKMFELKKEELEDLYINKEMSVLSICSYLKENKSLDINIRRIYRALENYGIPKRTFSEEALLRENGGLDHNKSYLNEDLIERIDGILLGDGCIHANQNKLKDKSRLGFAFKYEEFCNYMCENIKEYNPSPTKFIKASNPAKAGKSGGYYHSSTKIHNDLYIQYNRWYKDGRKIVPEDVRITSKSVLLWYLGDGSLTRTKKSIFHGLNLATCSFTKEEIDILINKFKLININSRMTYGNNLMINTDSLGDFFKLIGESSPVKCYEYKFNFDLHKIYGKRMSVVAEKVGIPYDKLCYLVKVKKINFYRKNSNSRPLFNKEHIEELKIFLENNSYFKSNFKIPESDVLV